MSARRGTEQALGRLHPGPGCDSALSPDADRNVLSHPSILLVVLLNVSLNTLPRLALPVIHQVLKKPHSKVRVGVPPCTFLGPINQSWCWEQVLQGDTELGVKGWRPRCTPSALRRGKY